MIEINKVALIEIGNFDFTVDFFYEGKVLQTNILPKSFTEEQVKAAIVATVDNFDQKRNADGFNILKQNLEVDKLIIELE